MGVMADAEHLEVLLQGTVAWNAWRQVNPKIMPDLRGAQLRGMDLSSAELHGADLSGAQLREAHLRRAVLHKVRLAGADLRWANLDEADLREAYLRQADLSGAHMREADMRGVYLREAYLCGANLTGANLTMADLRAARLCEAHLSEAQLHIARLRHADLSKADLREANFRGAQLRQTCLRGANLQEANFRWANVVMSDLYEADMTQADLRWANLSVSDLRYACLSEADLRGANLRGANLSAANLMKARLVETNFEEANLEGCAIYGISAWELKLEGARQVNLCITPEDEPAIIVDNLEVAQFLYLHLHNTSIRDVIGTIGKKIVLIVGDFSEERLEALEAVREVLRQYHYVPVFLACASSDAHAKLGTLELLAQLARFVLVDVTEAALPIDIVDAILGHISVPVQPIAWQPAMPPNEALWADRLSSDSLLPTYRYADAKAIWTSLYTDCLLAAETKAKVMLDLVPA
ncbi:MAG: hypothetical protein ETSY2_49570 [Candidatus Entotheonella gemina]|uniref:Pentapeptide repeat-containing protein n=1 Tax=Candidatus Entotheonella gemina TaxID=1429439 RepID=W4LA55_9BACT|nr:MAG: hypothetical protein ETSY2_49570 [Candidatus Entotheonella gemina]